MLINKRAHAHAHAHARTHAGGKSLLNSTCATWRDARASNAQDKQKIALAK